MSGALLLDGCSSRSPCQQKIETALGMELDGGVTIERCEFTGSDQEPAIFTVTASMAWTGGGQDLADRLRLHRKSLTESEVLYLEGMMEQDAFERNRRDLVPGRAFAQKNGALILMKYDATTGKAELRIRASPVFRKQQ